MAEKKRLETARYYKIRAAEERRMADASVDRSARCVHTEMARLYSEQPADPVTAS